MADLSAIFVAARAHAPNAERPWTIAQATFARLLWKPRAGNDLEPGVSHGMTLRPVGALAVEGIDAERGAVVVRSGNGRVALCVSLESNGDAEVVMLADDCKKLVAILQTAIKSSE